MWQRPGRQAKASDLVEKPLKNVSERVGNTMARSNYRTDIDENRLIPSYTLTVFRLASRAM